MAFESIHQRNLQVLSECQQRRDNSLPPGYEDDPDYFDVDDIDPGYDGILGEG